MRALIMKWWEAISEFGSIFFYLFMVAFMYILDMRKTALTLLIGMI